MASRDANAATALFFSGEIASGMMPGAGTERPERRQAPQVPGESADLWSVVRFLAR